MRPTVKTTATGATKTGSAAVATRPATKSAAMAATTWPTAAGAVLGMRNGDPRSGRKRKRHRNKGHGP